MNTDIKQIVLDVLTMWEDPDIGTVTEQEYEQVAIEVEKRVKESDSLPCVSDSFLEVVKQSLFNDWSESLISEEYDEDIPEHYWLQDMTIGDMMELLKSCR